MSFSVTSPSGTDSSCAPAGQAGSRSIPDEIPELCTAYTPFRTRNRRKSPPALYCSQVAPSASNGHLRSDPAIRRMSKSLSTHGFAERGRVSQHADCLLRSPRSPSTGGRHRPDGWAPSRISEPERNVFGVAAAAASVVPVLITNPINNLSTATADGSVPAGKAHGAERSFTTTFGGRLETGGILVCLYLYESPYVASR